MQGQHCHSSVVKVIEEDFVETPWRNTIMHMLNDTERVSEAGVIVDVPLGRGVIGKLQLQRMSCVVDIEEFLKDLRWHSNAPQTCEDAIKLAIFRSGGRTIGHQRCHSSAVGPCTKAFEEQGVKSVHGEDVGGEVVSECVRR